MDWIFLKVGSTKYLSLLALLILAFSCCVYIVFNFRKYSEKKYSLAIVTYFILIISQAIIGYYEALLDDRSNKGEMTATNISGYLFIVCEFIIFSFLLYSAGLSNFFNRILLINAFLFLTVAVFLWFSSLSIFEAVKNISTLESLSLILICLYCLLSIAKSKEYFYYTKNHIIWAAFGILILMTWLTPYYLLFDDKSVSDYIEMIDHLAYACVVFFLTKSFGVLIKSK